METHHLIFSPLSFLKRHIGTAPNVNEAKGDARHTISDYSILAVVIFLFTILFPSSHALATATETQLHQQTSHLLSWSCGNPTSGHCYGNIFWGGANGADTRISLNTSLSGGGSHSVAYFVTTELWLVSANATYWVEVGIESSAIKDGTLYPVYFWADNRPNSGGFSWHYFSLVNSSGNPLFRITRSGTDAWNVLVNDGNVYTGQSTANNFNVANIELGTEVYNNDMTAYEPNTYYTNNRWWDGSNFHYQANDGTIPKILPPVKADWYNHQDAASSSTGGTWYSCIPGHGC